MTDRITDDMRPLTRPHVPRCWQYHCDAGRYEAESLWRLALEILRHRWWHWRRGDGWVD